MRVHVHVRVHAHAHVHVHVFCKLIVLLIYGLACMNTKYIVQYEAPLEICPLENNMFMY